MTRGCRERLRGIQLISIRAVGLTKASDSEVLEWAAQDGYVVITHDVSTMTAAVYERVRSGLPHHGLVVVPQRLGIGESIERLHELLGQQGAPDALDWPVHWLWPGGNANRMRAFEEHARSSPFSSLAAGSLLPGPSCPMRS
jgi:hypothetical protein